MRRVRSTDQCRLGSGKKNFDIKDSLHFTGDLCCLKQKVGLETDTFDLSDQLDGIRGCISCD